MRENVREKFSFTQNALISIDKQTDSCSFFFRVDQTKLTTVELTTQLIRKLPNHKLETSEYKAKHFPYFEIFGALTKKYERGMCKQRAK